MYPNKKKKTRKNNRLNKNKIFCKKSHGIIRKRQDARYKIDLNKLENKYLVEKIAKTVIQLV